MDGDGHSLAIQINETFSTAVAASSFQRQSIAQTTDSNYVIAGYQEGVGVTIEKTAANGEVLAENSFAFSQHTTGHVIGTLQ
jgi:hypothetical protein